MVATKESTHIVGPTLIALAASIWGAGYFLKKIVLTSVDPTVLTAYTYFIVAVAFLFIEEVRGGVYPAFSSNRLLYSSLGILGVLASWSFHYGLGALPLSIAVLFEKIQPVFALVLARIFLGERFPVSKAPLGLIAMGAAYALVTKDPFNVSLEREITAVGLLSVACAALFWSLAGVVGKKAVKIGSSRVVTAVRIYVGSVVMALALLLRVWNQGLSILVISPLNLFLIGVAALASTMFGYLLFYKGLRTTDVGIASFIELTTPISGVVLGVLFLGESLDFLQYLSAVVLLLSVAMLSRKHT